MEREMIPLRGKLTDEVKQLSKELLNYEINKTELRLMSRLMAAGIGGCSIRDRLLQDTKFTYYINEWVVEDYIQIDPIHGVFSISPDFWSVMSQIVYQSYIGILWK